MTKSTKRLVRRSGGWLPLAILLGFLAPGCAGEKPVEQPQGPAKAGEMGPLLATETGPINEELAERGEALFQDKGCSGCHAFGTKVTGPDLARVTERRSRAWLERMIQEPVEMTRDDPTAHELLATHLVQMPDLSLDAEQTRQVIEYFRAKDTPDTDEEED